MLPFVDFDLQWVSLQLRVSLQLKPIADQSKKKKVLALRLAVAAVAAMIHLLVVLLTMSFYIGTNKVRCILSHYPIIIPSPLMQDKIY